MSLEAGKFMKESTGRFAVLGLWNFGRPVVECQKVHKIENKESDKIYF